MKRHRWPSALLGVALFFLSVRPARACGVSASGVASCGLAEHDEAVRPRWVVAASALYTIFFTIWA